MRTKSVALLCLLSAAALLAGACTSKPKGSVNTPPTAVVLAAPESGALPLPVDFSGALSSDAGGSIVSFDWDLGDGNSRTEEEFTHTYTAEGEYTVTLTVTDNKGATDTDTTTIDVGGPAEPAAGCHDSTNSVSIIYGGPIDSYKNAQVANSTAGCGSEPLDNHVTVVSALDRAQATAVCQGGADPAVSGVINLTAAGFASLPTTAWLCLNPLGIPELLQVGTCHPIGTASVEYLGPRHSYDNVNLHNGNTCDGAAIGTSTYVQHSTQPAAIAACAAVDGAFNRATSLAVLIPTLPGDTYLCHTVV